MAEQVTDGDSVTISLFVLVQEFLFEELENQIESKTKILVMRRAVSLILPSTCFSSLTWLNQKLSGNSPTFTLTSLTLLENGKCIKKIKIAIACVLHIV